MPTKLLYNLVKASFYRATYHPHYKKKLGMTKSAHNPLIVWPSPKLLLLLGNWFNNVVKFDTYHLYYNGKVAANPTRAFVYVADNFYFLSKFDNLLVASPLFTSDCKACAA